MTRVPQPAINSAKRDPEIHGFWFAGIVAVVAGVMVAVGARHSTTVETTDAAPAFEHQLVKAFSNGGLRYPGQEPAPLPPPPIPGDPGAGEALERWARQNAQAAAPTWKVRVDVRAQAFCPT